MKIVAVLNEEPAAGGGFSQSLNAVLQMQRLCAGRYELLVVTTVQANLPVLASLGLDARWIPLTLADRLLTALHPLGLWQRLQHRFRWVLGFEAQLVRLGCDLVYLTSPRGLPAPPVSLNHIATLWDLCHAQQPEFPEVRQFHTAALRDRNYLALMHSAVLTLTDSPSLAALVVERYGIPRERLLPMPFAPSPLLSAEATDDGADSSRNDVPNEDYLLYPANLWPHKNHLRVQQALVELGRRGWRPVVVFCGRDQGGQRAHLARHAQQQGITAQVLFLDFVPPDRLSRLYRHALAVVMPTYFGPTNLPPLEAWAFGTPLVYSSTLAEQAGDAALLVDPDDAQALADALWACRDPQVRLRLREAGHRRLETIAADRAQAEAALADHLAAFAARRDCWA